MALAAVDGDVESKEPVSCEDASKHQWRLLSGSRDNTIRVWDMATKCPITTITGHTDDVLGLAIGYRDEFYSASSDHTVRMWSLETYNCLRIFLNEDAIFLSVACTHDGVLTGSSDGLVRFWEVDTADTPVGKGALSPDTRKKGMNFRQPALESHLHRTKTFARQESRKLQSEMEELLRTFVGIRTVSVDRSRAGQDQAWKGANFLKGLLETIGAEVKLVVGQENTNPVVMGRLIQDPSAMTVTISGHYDVNAAPEEGWRTDPWELAAIDGFLYGRGVSDCKGPIVSTLSAVRELVSKGDLKVNVIFVFDGMNENGCLGFREAVQSNLEWFEGTQLILTSNTAWLSDNHPCLTYGMRGLICLVFEVTGPEKNLHSGSDGGSFTEPMNNLVAVLSNLVDSNNMILVPGFYDDVKPLDREEEALYEGLTFKLAEYKAASGLKDLTGSTSREVLMNRWRNPSLSILGIESGAVGWSTIPKGCSARICIRHVPNQDPERLIEKIRAHAAHEFAKLRARGNRLEVKVQHVGDWWLADPNNVFYRTAEQAIGRQWGVRPMYVREGGTMPVVPFLEKALEAPALHLPISQASDHTALQNERLRWINFVKGKDVVKDFLNALGSMDPTELPPRRRSSGSH